MYALCPALAPAPRPYYLLSRGRDSGIQLLRWLEFTGVSFSVVNTLRSEKPFQNPPRQTEAHCSSATNREHQKEQPWGTVVVNFLNFYANASFKQRLSSSVFSALNTKIRRTSTATLWVGLRLHSRTKYIYSRFCRLKSFARYIDLFSAHFCRLLHERNPFFFLLFRCNHSSSGSLLTGAMTCL